VLPASSPYLRYAVCIGVVRRRNGVTTNKDSNTDQKPLRSPDEWKTGDEPMTAAQKSYIETLATEAGEDVNADALTKADASKLIDDLQEKTGRGK
jgi:hypothetical protein